VTFPTYDLIGGGITLKRWPMVSPNCKSNTIVCRLSDTDHMQGSCCVPKDLVCRGTLATGRHPCPQCTDKETEPQQV
jgi:hypothetical protein